MAQIACIWEVTARKPGNVNPHHNFADATLADYLLSSVMIGPVLDAAESMGVGLTVLQGVQGTRMLVSTNTNLGILLLLAPLAAVPAKEDPRRELDRVLSAATVTDSKLVYNAIRLADPGGMGQAPSQDIGSEPTVQLRQLMALAADRDLVARQYANGFKEVFDEGMPALRRGWKQTQSVEGGILACHLHLMAAFPDTLIARKRGQAEAEEAAQRARKVLDLDWPASAAGRLAFRDLDAWLRAVGNRRNPGTTADLVTASLFVALRTGIMELPSPLPWSAGAIDHE